MAIGRDNVYYSVILLLLGVTWVIEIREGVIFNKVNDIILSRSRWLMTLVVDLDSYQNFLQKLSADIERANSLAVIMSQRYTRIGQANYVSIFQGMKNEIKALR